MDLEIVGLLLATAALGFAGYVLQPMRKRLKRFRMKYKDFEIDASADDSLEPAQPELEATLEATTVEEVLALPEATPPAALPSAPSGTACRVQLDRLPVPGREFFGRDEEIAMLDRAWDDPDALVQSLVAFGGVGKTSLVHHWLDGLRGDGWRGAEVVFGWSFDSQGSGEERQTSADLFLDEALGFFGVTDPPTSRRDRALRLAERIRAQRTLLVLDGLEPLQHPPNVPSIGGEVKDKALATLLKALARDQPGLTVISTRETIKNLEGFSTARRHDLERLDVDASVALLRSFGLHGRDAEFREIADALRGHALTLTLLGTYLRDACERDVRQWRDVPLLDAAEAMRDEKAFRVMAKYADWFDGPERQILSIVGLFDRPADAGAVAALRAGPAIPGLTDRLVDLPSVRWNLAVSKLREARLLLGASPDAPNALDAHPLVREHFGRVLADGDDEAFRAGHARLYEHYAASAPDQPDTLEEMQPLYRAVHHGCRADRRQETFDEVYLRRIRRGNEAYSVHKLGAFGADLTAVSIFFERTWDRPAVDLREENRAWLLNTAAFCLRALGRLDEAVQPMEASLEQVKGAEDWKGAATVTSNLSELTLTLGRADDAVGHGESSVELADRSGDDFQRMGSRTAWGEALHAAGRLDEAESAFREAESIQAEWQPQYPKLYSLWGYRFCDLLLDRGRYEEVRERVTQALSWSTAQGFLLDIALDHLSLGRAHLGLAQADGRGFDDAAASLDRAVQGLRKAGYENWLPSGLVARATLHRFHEDVPAAENDLEEALEIAERGSMKLHECDAHLEWGRLRLSVGDRDGVREHLERAAVLVEETGYRRRDGEVRELREACS